MKKDTNQNVEKIRSYLSELKQGKKLLKLSKVREIERLILTSGFIEGLERLMEKYKFDEYGMLKDVSKTDDYLKEWGKFWEKYQPIDKIERTVQRYFHRRYFLKKDTFPDPIIHLEDMYSCKECIHKFRQDKATEEDYCPECTCPSCQKKDFRPRCHICGSLDLSEFKRVFVEIFIDTTRQQLIERWKSIKENRDHYLGEPKEMTTNYERDKEWYLLHLEGKSYNEIAEIWKKEHPEDVEKLVSGHIKKKVKCSGKKLDSEEEMRIYEEYCNSPEAWGLSYFEDVIRRAIERFEEGLKT
ncbi:MAG: hypothetical protein KKA99_07000 [Gammaproteobacteria bacterium]|nr:hypothetical protein [Gammaproteobacteria bacterium]MBU1629434.1 hypothetical protein [Gammaproteobacteria bacterium]MBU1927315.1 hypothetical protein [Gammaproteobacteria bacterium]